MGRFLFALVLTFSSATVDAAFAKGGRGTFIRYAHAFSFSIATCE